MPQDLNILILSCGTRNKIVQYFKKELKGRGKVIATDCSPLAPALYEADKHYIVPKINEDGYLDTILTICKENNVKGVLTLIDPEISLLAQNKKAFLDIGTIPIVSELDIVEMSFNKYKMYKYLVENNFPTVLTFIDKNKFYKSVEEGIIDYPVFVKPVTGSASININKIYSKEEIEILFDRYNDLIIQEFMVGKEYGIDVYIDMLSKEPVSIFIKEKIKMRGGETDKSVSVKDERLINFIRDFVIKTGYKGIVDIDLFEREGNYFISEVNPRFGGGYPHAYENNINVPKMIINNLEGNINPNICGLYESGNYMLKFNELKFMK